MKTRESHIVLFLLLTLLIYVQGCREPAGDFTYETDRFGRTHLHFAAITNDQSVLDSLLSCNPDPDLQDSLGFTALHYAALKGNTGIVEALLNTGANPDLTDHYNCTPLFHASERGHFDIVRLLCGFGADKGIRDKNGVSAEEIAFGENYSDISEYLDPLFRLFLENREDSIKSWLRAWPEQMYRQNVRGRTPLHLAYLFGMDSLASWMINKGANQDVRDIYAFRPFYYSASSRADRTGVDLIGAALERAVDSRVYDVIDQYDHVNIGLIKNGQLAFTRSYGNNVIDDPFAWGSVSKGATTIILYQLVEEGRIRSLDDNIWVYADRYNNCMPERYADSPLTIRHLILHTGGVPHNDEPTWNSGKLNLKFRPGEDVKYSTPGYGILGHVISGATGMSYPEAVIHYLGKPVDAGSVWVEDHFRAPGARINSSIRDFALFARGIMDQTYLPDSVLYEEIFVSPVDGKGLGWPCSGQGTNELMARISGSNGIPQAHMVIKPKQKQGVVLLAHTKNRHSFELNELGNKIFSELENEIKNEK